MRVSWRWTVVCLCPTGSQKSGSMCKEGGGGGREDELQPRRGGGHVIGVSCVAMGCHPCGGSPSREEREHLDHWREGDLHLATWAEAVRAPATCPDWNRLAARGLCVYPARMRVSDACREQGARSALESKERPWSDSPELAQRTIDTRRLQQRHLIVSAD